MNDDTFRAWALEQWQREAIKRTPLGRSIRNAKAQSRVLKREHKAMLRSLAARNGARLRLVRKQQAESEEAMRKRRAAADAKLEQQLWGLLLSQGGPGV